MRAKFYINNSDNIVVNKNLTVINMGSEYMDVPFDFQKAHTMYRDDGSYNVGFTFTSPTQLDVYWNGSPGIGCALYYNAAIDLTDVDEVKVSVNNGTCYGLGDQPVSPDWAVQIGFQASVPPANDVPSISDPIWLAARDFPLSNHDYGEVSIDTSGITGLCYLVINAHGWNSTISNLKFPQIVPVYEVPVILKTDTDLGIPRLELAYKDFLMEANYCKIEDKYYYLSEPESGANRLYFNAELDKLMTFREDILKLGCLIDRQENTFNTYFKDTEVPLLSNKKVNTIQFPYGFPDTDQLILATV